ARHEAGKASQTGNPRRCKRSCRWHRIGISSRSSGEEVGHVEPSRLPEEDNRNKRRLKTQLVDRAHIFAHVVDPIPTAQSRSVVAKDIPGKAHARAPSGGDTVAERGACA